MDKKQYSMAESFKNFVLSLWLSLLIFFQFIDVLLWFDVIGSPLSSYFILSNIIILIILSNMWFEKVFSI